MLNILGTADWHLGTFRSPVKDGVNLRTEDTKRCLDELVRVAKEEQPDYSLISGDVFDAGKIWSDRCCEEIITAIHYIRELAAVSKQVVVMRGTPNHDGAGQFNVLSEMFADCENVHIVTTPQVIAFEDVDIAVLPGFDRGVYRAKFPGLSSEEENEVFTQELSNIVLGLKAQCEPGKKSVLMAHYTVPGCNTESGQTMMLTQFEPIIPREALLAADYDLVALGHIHRPQKLNGLRNAYYSGAINAMNFNDEGQERGFWIHNWNLLGELRSFFHKTPIREFVTIELNDEDITQLNMGAMDFVATEKWRGEIDEKIVRVHYSCSAENSKALNKAVLEKEFLDDGAFMVWEILPDKIDEFANRTELTNATDPEANLIRYLEEKQVPPEKVQELVMKARPIIAEAEASMTAAANTGTFEPIEIAVKNYRNYEEETFNFEDITFCTINGQNGAGKSSLFMDAIIDCLFEEPREGVIKDDTGKSPWLRNDEKARSGSIMFTFRIGEKKYRVTRTRARSGKGTLNIAQLVDGEWEDCSKERYNDTQQEILNILGMDSFTFKSCALIMQDQYGLFLQAKPEERVEVLGTLLGLGVYQIMEKIAADKAKVNGAKGRELKQEVEIHNSTIASFGKPDEELEACRTELAGYESSLQMKIAERDQQKLILANQQAAAERRAKLLASVTTLQEKKAATEQNRATQQAIADSSAAILAGRAEIEAKTAEHKALLEREIALAGESALYSSKKREAENYAAQMKSEQEGIDAYSARVKQKENELSLAQPTDQDAVIKENAAEYERQKKLLDEMQEKAVAYQKAKTEYSAAVFHQDEVVRQFEGETRAAEEQKKVLERKVAILAESGCVDIDNAHCKFLQDAIEAIMVMIIDDGNDMEDPVDWDSIRGIDELLVFERPLVTPDYNSIYNHKPKDRKWSKFGMPEYYDISPIYGSPFRVHESRCLLFKNGKLPQSSSRTEYRFFGMPEYTKIHKALQETVTSHGNGVKLLDRAVQAIYKMNDLAQLLETEEGEDIVLRRLRIIDMAKGIINSIAIDANGEDYDYKTITFSGVKDIIDTTCNMLSAVTNIPQTKLFGRSPAGENATGEGDMENYYTFVRKIQKLNLKKNLGTLIDIILIVGKCKGKFEEIPDYVLEFNPLWNLSEAEQAGVDQTKAATELTKAQTAQVYVDMQALDASEVRKRLAENGEFTVNDILDEEEDWNEVEEEGEPDSGESAETSDTALTAEPGTPTPQGDVEMDAVTPTGCGVLVIEDGKILVGERKDSGLLCGPGGHIEPGETPEDAAIRETREEFGINIAETIPLTVISGMPEEYCPSQIFLCTEFYGTPIAFNTEMENARFEPVADILKKRMFLPFELSVRELLNVLHGMNQDAANADDWITVNGQHIEVNENGEQISGNPKVLGNSESKKTEKTVDHKAAREYSKSIKGVVTVNGTEMKGVSGHAAYRMKERGLSAEDVKEALTGAGISYPGNMKHPDAECYQHKGMRMVVSSNGVLITAIDLEAN